MNATTTPPIPPRIRAILADYPDLLERLKEVLALSAERSRRIPLAPFDDAISALEGRLGSFIAEAAKQVKHAEATGDPVEIAEAEAKEMAVLKAHSPNGGMGDLAELLQYFNDLQGHS